MKKEKKEKTKQKCNHIWYGRRYCHKCNQIEMWGSITGDTALDLENQLMTGTYIITKKSKKMKKGRQNNN